MEKRATVIGTEAAAVHRFVKVFAFTFAIVFSASGVRSAWQRRRNATSPQHPPIIRSAKIALFPALLPQVYTSAKRRFPTVPFLNELLSSPTLLLIPPSWRIQITLQLATDALLHTGKGSQWRKKLPPTWTLNVIGNIWLLWAFLFNDRAFPKAYEKVILSHSTRYVPKGTSKQDLDKILSGQLSEQMPLKSDAYTHHNHQCSQLHPSQPSCVLNYLDGLVFEFLRVGRWMGVFFAVIISLQKRKEILKGDVKNALRSWIDATVRGTMFVSGSINTSWATTCLLQRILPRNVLPRARYAINATLASLWILILPDNRRAAISLYVARLAAQCAWEAWKLEGGCTIPYGECFLFAMSWGQLARVQKQGTKVGGSSGYILRQLDEYADIGHR